MRLDALTRPWVGSALRHTPADAKLGVLDFRYAGRGKLNRWNEDHEPTLYLAADEGVLITEWGRHFSLHRREPGRGATVARSVHRLTLVLGATIDLRDPAVCSALSIEHAPHRFTDVAVARATARFLRRTTDAQAIFVPPIGMLDQPERWCLVLFLEKLPDDPRRFVTDVTTTGPLRWG